MLRLVDSRWYVVIGGWVKFVNNLFKSSGLSSVLLSTIYKKDSLLLNIDNVQVWVVQVFYTFLYSYLSTHKNHDYNLLINTYPYYPQYLLLRPIKKI